MKIGLKFMSFTGRITLPSGQRIRYLLHLLENIIHLSTSYTPAPRLRPQPDWLCFFDTLGTLIWSMPTVASQIAEGGAECAGAAIQLQDTGCMTL